MLSPRHFEPYGELYGGTMNEGPSGFTGQWRDSETELYDLRARMYSPRLGSFASRDPYAGTAARPMSLNGYSWVEGRVADGRDPSGMMILDEYASALSCIKIDSLLKPQYFQQTQRDIAEIIVRQSQVLIIVGNDNEFCQPLHNSVVGFDVCVGLGTSMGTLTSEGIYSHDHWAGLGIGPLPLYPLINFWAIANIFALSQFDWVAFRGHKGAWYVRPEEDLLSAVSIVPADVGILRFTPINISLNDIGTPVNRFLRNGFLNPGDLVFGAYIPGFGDFGNNHSQIHSSIRLAIGFVDTYWPYDASGDGRQRNHAFTVNWSEGLFAPGESGSGVFNINLEYVGSLTAGAPEETPWSLIDRLIR